MMLILWMLTMADPGFTRSGLRLEHEDFIKPVAVVSAVEPDAFYVLDRGAHCVHYLKHGALLHTIGRQGRGPGELVDPIAMGLKDGLIWVYDAGGGKIVSFETDGKLHAERKTVRAATASFEEDAIILHTPLASTLYQVIDYQGNLQAEFGRGMQQKVDFQNLDRFLRVHTRDETYLYSLKVDGSEWVRFSWAEPDRAQSVRLGFDPSSFSAERKIQATGENVFTIRNGQPVKAAQIREGILWVLLENENEEESSSILGFDAQGRLRHRFPTKSYYQNFTIQGSLAYGFNYLDAFIEVLTLSN